MCLFHCNCFERIIIYINKVSILQRMNSSTIYLTFTTVVIDGTYGRSLRMVSINWLSLEIKREKRPQISEVLSK